MVFSTYPVGKREEGYNAFGQPTNSFTFVDNAEIFISLKTQKNTLDPRFVEQTHIGLTTAKWITVDMLIDNKYKVLLVNEEHRLTTLHLAEV